MSLQMPSLCLGRGRALRKDRKKGVALSLVLASGLFFQVDLQAGGGGTITGTVTWGPQRLNNAVVYIEKVEGTFPPPQEAAVMAQRKLTFVPHVLPILVGTTVNFTSYDKELHNIRAVQEKRTLFNFGMPPGAEPVPKTFRREGVVSLLCSRHQEMSAYIVILQNPFVALTNEEGEFAIKNVPRGSYTVKTWHEKPKPQSQEVKVTEGGNVRVDFKLRN